MMRRLRFKFVMKILLHEINVLAEKMLELAKEFDKIDHIEKMAIIVDAFKNREELADYGITYVVLKISRDRY
nr:ulp1 protease family, C-terminal catalytic domain-containing protein [Tanacetum cinerariifolium]